MTKVFWQKIEILGSKTSISEEACVMLIPISSRPIAYTTYQVPNTICLIPTTYLQNRYICSTIPTKIGLFFSHMYSSALQQSAYILLHSTYSTVSTHTSKYLLEMVAWCNPLLSICGCIACIHSSFLAVNYGT